MTLIYILSEFNPIVTSHALDTYINLVKTDLDVLKNHVKDSDIRHPNITREEMSAMKELANNQNITIKSADKGGAKVIMDTHNNMEEIRRQLAGTQVYQLLSGDPLWTIKTRIDELLKMVLNTGIINKKIRDFVEHPITPILYILPKKHKSLKKNLGRPIVSGRGRVLSNISRFLDQVLRPFVYKMRSYIRDTSDFLKCIKSV